MSFVVVIALVLFLCMLAFAFVLAGWRDALAQQPPVSEGSESDLPKVTLIIPVRNEEENIAAVLQDAYAQRYPRALLEVIVVDDHSEDPTASIAKGMIRTWPQLQVIDSNGTGKKAAIGTGVEAATGELILLTDGDVRFGPDRVAVVANYFRQASCDLLVLPVVTTGSGFIGRVQEDEQMALLGVTMGTAALGKPVLAYGANLAFAREAFLAVGGYKEDRYASGDDIFLMRRMAQAGRAVGSLFRPEVVVHTAAEPTLAGAWRQRVRWAGKMRGVLDTSTWLALVVLLLPWVLLQRTCAFELRPSMGQHALYTAALLVAAWLLWALPVLSLATRVRQVLVKPAPTARMLFSLLVFTCYAPVVGIASLLLRPRWKGRRV